MGTSPFGGFMAGLSYLDRGKLKIEELLENRSIPTHHQNRIGASALGGPCDRQIWYKWRWVQQNFITPRIKRLFNRGSQEEPIVYEELEEVGVVIHSTQDFKHFCHGYGGLMHDGIISNVPDAPKAMHILEIKTGNQKNFDKVKRNGVQKAKPEHYLQIQMYMRHWEIDRGLYIFSNKQDDQRHYERVRLDKEISIKAEKRCEKIVLSETPPQRAGETMDKWPCMWCDYKLVCFKGKPVAKNCRTCKHVNLIGDGQWGCGLRDDKVLKHPASKKKRAKGKLSAQEKGCDLWEINPGL